MAVTQNATMHAGEDLTITIDLSAADSVLGLTGHWVLQSMASDAAALVDTDALTVDTIGKTCDVALDSADTSDLAAGAYYQTLWLIDGSGHRVASETGTLTILAPPPAAVLA